jgi:pimeloyl-ACP methyl ester carboxylesterase
LILDKFDSASRAGGIDVPVLIASAENDREIGLSHTLVLKKNFKPALVMYQMITGAAHNNIIDFPEYRALVERFLLERKPKPGGS